MGPCYTPRISPPHNTPSAQRYVHLWILYLARGTAAGDVLASGGLLAASDGVAAPGPVGARTLAAENVDVSGRARDGSGVLGHGQASTVGFVSQNTQKIEFRRDIAYIGTPVVGVPVGLPFS